MDINKILGIIAFGLAIGIFIYLYFDNKKSSKK